MADPFTRRVPKKFTLTTTFATGAGTGSIGTVAVSTVTGSVLIVWGAVRCTTTLVGASGTISLGVAGNTAALIPVTTASLITTGKFWQDATPEAGVSPAIVNQVVTGNLIYTIATTNLSAGVLELVFFYLPLSSDGNMA